MEEIDPFKDWAEYQVIGDDVLWFDVRHSTKLFGYQLKEDEYANMYKTEEGRFFSLIKDDFGIVFKYFTKSSVYMVLDIEHKKIISQLNIQNG